MFQELDMDLLEAVNISNVFNQPKNQEVNISEQIISENDMLFDIYDNQRFLIEQDAMIFQNLNYGIVSEGVVSTVLNTIKEFFGKIKKLILKFINFIIGKFKKDKEEESQNNDDIKDAESAKKAMNQAEENIKQTTTDIQIIKKKINSKKSSTSQSYSSASNKSASSKSSASNDNSKYEEFSKESEKIENMIKELEEEKNSDIFKPIIISDAARKFTNTFIKENIQDVYKDFLEIITDIVNRINSISNNDLNEVKRDVDDATESLKESYNTARSAVDGVRIGEKCNYNTYASYMTDNHKFMQNYKNEIPKYISELKGIIDSKITPAENQINKVRLLDNPNPEINKLLSTLSQFVSLNYSLISVTINFLVNLESCYGMHKINMKKIKHIKQKSEEIKKAKDNLSKKVA